MIFAVVKNRLLNLLHDRAAFVLSFVLPVVFFSIFAGIFGGSGRSATRKIRVAIVDEDQSPNSKRFVAALVAEEGLRVRTATEDEEKKTSTPYTAVTAERAVKGGDIPVALILPKGFGATPIRFGPSASRPRLLLLSDSADPVAPQVLAGLVQKVAMTAMPESMARSGMEAMDQWSGGLTPEQRARIEGNLKDLEQRTRTLPAKSPEAASTSGGGLIDVEIRDLVGEKKKNPMVAYYAAGIGVMFLLFTAAGAGGALIEEAESGTLDRVLSTQVSMTKLLLGKLLYLAGIAATQLTIMFLWGSLLFGLEMTNHWAGFIVMTVATALAASTLGLLLAAICRSRMQLVALSNLLILVMSALGGSMFPRFLMPEKIQKIALVTLNAWALDGFQKVFWRDEPVWNLWPQVAVLLSAALILFAAARRVARRWDVA